MTSAQCKQTAEDWYNKGIELICQGKNDAAIKAFGESLLLFYIGLNKPNFRQQVPFLDVSI